MTKRMSPARFALVAAFVLLALTLVPVALAAKGGNGGGHSGTSGGGHNGGGGSSSGCSISPSQAVLDQVWTVSASGLPSSTVNQIITFPNGGQLTGTITVNSDGTYTTTGNSNMSATWGFITPEQTGTYTYQYVGRVKWPAGTFTKLYAECSVVVSSS